MNIPSIQRAGPEGGFEMLIWVLVGLFWIFGQIAEAKKRAARKAALDTAPPSPPKNPEPVGRPDRPAPVLRTVNPQKEIEAFLRSLTGGLPPETPQPIEKKPPVPLKKREHPKVSIAPRPRQQAQPAAQPEDFYSQPAAETFNAPPVSSLLMMKMPRTSVPIMKSTAFAPAAHNGPPFRIHGRHAVRRAMLHHLVFSPPVSLEQNHART